MGKTEGTSSKRRKKMVDKTDDDAGVLHAQKNVEVQSNTGARVTRSKATNTQPSSVIPVNHDAATVHYQNQLMCAIAGICPRQTPDADLKPVCITAAGIRKIEGTKGVGSNPPKLYAARSFIQENDSRSPDREKQPAEEFFDENISHGNKGGACPSRNSNPSNVRSFRSPQMKVVDEFELHDELQPRPLTVASCTQLVKNVLPSAAEKTGLRFAHSFNLTEIAAKMDDHSSSEDEQAESSIALVFINVEGYLVKKEVAPMLQQIIDKHNDIARDCIIKNREIIVPILEVICSYCQKLENTYVKDIMDTEVKDMALVVENFQQLGFDVKWLIERLKDVSETKRLMKGYPTLKQEKTKVEMKQKEVDMLKQKWSVAEAELATMKVDFDEKYHEFDRQIKALKVRGLPFWDKPLLYGLI